MNVKTKFLVLLYFIDIVSAVYDLYNLHDKYLTIGLQLVVE